MKVGGDADYSKFYLFGDLFLWKFASLGITRDKVTQGFSLIYLEYGEENFISFLLLTQNTSLKVKLDKTWISPSFSSSEKKRDKGTQAFVQIHRNYLRNFLQLE